MPRFRRNSKVSSEELFVEPLAVKDGSVRVATAPELGMASTEEISAKYR